MHRSIALMAASILTLFPASLLKASLITITFDELSDLDSVTTQYLGLTFSNAIVLASGGSLNEYEFPPHSSTNVVSDDGGPISILFSVPVSYFGGYFTYTAPLSLTAYDALGNAVASTTSLYSSNLALSGDAGSTPNEFLFVLGSAPVARAVLTGDPAGGSFTMDDIEAGVPDNSVPEPGTGSLLLMGAAAIASFLKRRRSLPEYRG